MPHAYGSPASGSWVGGYPRYKRVGLRLKPKNAAMDAALFRSIFETPFGPMQLAVDVDGALVETWLPKRGCAFDSHGPVPRTAEGGMRVATQQFGEYFRGERRVFDLRLKPNGTPFERAVWKRVCEIPYGATVSYGAIAADLGVANAARAVGRANGRNPIPIIIPCHRVVGSNGKLTGYGGGLPLKRALLELEGAICGSYPLPMALIDSGGVSTTAAPRIGRAQASP